MAGSLLVQEAGGVVSDQSGNKFTWGTIGIIAANPALHRIMKDEIFV
ncbi:inositol monophosphatase family protein [Paenibacillus alvei]